MTRRPAGRIAAFDLETTHLRGNMGHILCAVLKWVDRPGKPLVWRIDASPGYGKTAASYRDDSAIVKGLIEALAGADATLAHYGERFDKPYLNTRAMAHGIPVPPPLPIIDPWKVIRKELALTNNRLGSVSDLIGAKRSKYHLPWHDWQAAAYGDRQAMNRMVKYCVNDVLTLEQEYLAIRPLIRNHPYMGAVAEGRLEKAGPAECPACGSAATQSRGTRRTKRLVIERRRCTGCGSWFDGNRISV